MKPRLARGGDWVAAGKLGIAKPPGKKPCLIGDGTVSGANGCSRILEKTRLPTFESLQQFASRQNHMRLGAVCVLMCVVHTSWCECAQKSRGFLASRCRTGGLHTAAATLAAAGQPTGLRASQPCL